MILPKTAQVASYCGLFLILLFFFSFDVALTLSISIYLAINAKNYIKLVGVSFILFITDIVFRNFDISFRFISDLSLSSYILLLTATYIYTKSSKRITDFIQQSGKSGRRFFSSINLALLVVSSVLVLLLLPILGPPLAVIAGYLTFSYFGKRFTGKFTYATGLFFLLFCPFFIIAGKDSLSENFAIISFYFLLIGTVQKVVRLVMSRKGELDGWIKMSFIGSKRKETVREPVKEDIIGDRVSRYTSFKFRLPIVNLRAGIWHLIHSIRLPQHTILPVSQNGEKIFGKWKNIHNRNFTTNETAPKRFHPIGKFIIIAGISGLVSLTVVTFSFKNEFMINNVSTMKTSKSQKITPVTTQKPTTGLIIQTPTIDTSSEISSLSAQLKVMVANGTEISGLAASTAARLKDAGFKNVDTGNAARSDYKNWEITLNRDDPVLINYIKRELRLDALTVHKASESAKFDVLIIAGSTLP